MSQNLDRGLLYGDGFFTTIRVVGNEIHRWPLHRERIIFSTERLKFYGLDLEQIYKNLMEFILQQEEANGVLRLTISRGLNGAGERGYTIPREPNYQQYLSWSAISREQLEALHEGVALSVCEIPISSNESLAGIKHLNRLDQVLASEEIADGCFDSLMLSDGHIVSGTKTNVYFYLDGHWLTPNLDRAGVNGTVRRWLLNTQNDVTISQFGMEIFEQAEYCLVSNAIVGIIPVTQIRFADKTFNFQRYPKLEQLQEEYNEVDITY